MPVSIHVYIATNKGLVGIQNITDLQERDLQSVITLNGSTDLASISPAYHRFVQKSTGLIEGEFGGASYRANISRNIDQGNSWQLPFYLAHYIESFSNTGYSKGEHSLQEDVCLGQGHVQAGDIVLIATGQINTSTKAIEAVEQIPEKCITASAQIKLWMKRGILVEFFIPASSNNDPAKRQDNVDLPKLLPDVDCAIYPVIDLCQLNEHIEQYFPEAHKPASTLSAEVLTKKAVEKNTTHTAELSTKRVPIFVMFVLASLLVTGAVLFYFAKVNTVETPIRFINTSKAGLHCDSTAVNELIDVAEQYVTRLPKASFLDTCRLRLVTHQSVPQVWFVSDTKTLIELNSEMVNSERHWHIPLPSQQQESREYTLIVTSDYLDLADLAAFKSYLSRLDTEQQPSIEVLASFFAKINVNPQYIKQQLVVIPN